MKSLRLKVSTLGAVFVAMSGAANAQYVFNGSVSSDWSNTANWNGGAKAPDNDTGTGTAIESTTNDLVLNNNKRVKDLSFRTARTVNVNGKTLQSDGVYVDMTTGNGTGTISNGGSFQSYNNLTLSAAVGDTLLMNIYAKPVGSNNRTNQVSGGGTVVINGGYDHDNKQISWNVSSNTTFINNTYLNSNGGGALTVGTGSTYSGTGSASQATNTIDGTISPSTGNSNAGIGSLSFNNSLTIGSTGSYTAGLTRGTPASSDKITANGITLAVGSTLSLAAVAGSVWNVNDIYFLMINSAANSTAISGIFSGLTEGSTYTFDTQQFKVTYQADSVGNTFTGGNDFALKVIPEPGAALLGALGLIALLRRRRF